MDILSILQGMDRKGDYVTVNDLLEAIAKAEEKQRVTAIKAAQAAAIVEPVQTVEAAPVEEVAVQDVTL